MSDSSTASAMAADLGHIVDDLRPLAQPVDIAVLDPANAREGHDLEGIAASLRVYGQRTPIVVNLDENGRIEKGNGTYRAATEVLGWTHLAMVLVRDDPTTATGYAIADNKLSDTSRFNQETLAMLLGALPSELPTGFGDEELAQILAEHEAALLSAEPGDAEPQISRKDELCEKWATERGQLWLLPSRSGQRDHYLLCGDAASGGDLARVLVGGVHPHIVWSDPPYGVSYEGKTADALTIENDDLSEPELAELLTSAFGLAASACHDGAAWYVCAPAGPLNRLFGNALAELGIWRQTLVWEKQHFAFGRSDYHYRHEPIFYGWVPGAAHYFVDDRTQDSILQFDRPMVSAEHPTMKPTPLIEQCLRNSAKAGWLVLDMFTGSGSTLIAAENCAMAFAGLEIDPGFVAVILERYQEAFGIAPRLVAEDADQQGSG